MSIKSNFTSTIGFTRSNPDYYALLTALAQETDPILRQAIKDQIVFTSPLRRDEKQLFEYAYFDYIEDNPGYIEPYASKDYSYMYVLPNYVVDGYINIENSNAQDLYVLAGYVLDGYVASSKRSIRSSWSAYVGEYCNQDGETT